MMWRDKWKSAAVRVVTIVDGTKDYPNVERVMVRDGVMYDCSIRTAEKHRLIPLRLLKWLTVRGGLVTVKIKRKGGRVESYACRTASVSINSGSGSKVYLDTRLHWYDFPLDGTIEWVEITPAKQQPRNYEED